MDNYCSGRIDFWYFSLLLSAAFLLFLTIVVICSSIFTYSFDCKDKHVLITGGSSGIGLAVAKEYLKKGANITIMARDMEKLDAAKKILLPLVVEGKQKIVCVSCDCSSSLSSVESSLKTSAMELGDVDILVNCAGTSFADPFDTVDPEIFEKLLKTNVLGSIYPTRAVVSGMKRKNAGRIVFVASQVAQVAIHGYSAYAASKWAIRGMAEALQMELKPFNILVSVSYPPDTETPGYQTEMQTKPLLTKLLSESGQVFRAENVARDIVNYSCKGYFGISTGLDGWLLKQLHPGMSPINNIWEATQQVLFGPLCRVIAIFYLLTWDAMVKADHKKNNSIKNK